MGCLQVVNGCISSKGSTHINAAFVQDTDLLESVTSNVVLSQDIDGKRVFESAYPWYR